MASAVGMTCTPAAALTVIELVQASPQLLVAAHLGAEHARFERLKGATRRHRFG
jgi:hypothetical protein